MNINRKKIFTLLFLATVIFNQKSFGKAIIWDLGGTLIKTSKYKVAKEIGIGNFISYALFDWHNPANIKEHTFAFLDILKFEPFDKYHPQSDDGQMLPPIMCDWLKGKINGPEILNKSKYLMNNYNNYRYFFISKRHKKLISRTIENIFNPKKLANKFNCIKPAIKILEECASQRKKDGTSKHKLFILSNFDLLTFNEFCKLPESRKVLRFFKPENIVISADLGLVKPDPEIFKCFLKKFNLKSKECIFIDDQLENIIEAENVGITSLFLEKKNYRKLKNQLQSLNII